MKYRIIALLLLIFTHIGAPLSVNAENPVVIRRTDIIPSAERAWQGWGTSLCWWANRIGYSPELVGRAAGMFFDKESGLGLNIMRYNIGGGDDPSHHHITRTDSDIPGWFSYDATTESYTFNPIADRRQLNMLEAAAKAAGNEAYIEVFSNSPPYFMTNSGCSTGNFNAAENNLRDDRYTEFAEYLSVVAAFMQDSLGLKIGSIAPMNEPNTNYWGAGSAKQEGCHFDSGVSQSRIVTETAKAMERHGLDNVTLTASDETDPGRQLRELREFSDTALEHIGRINTHTYGIGGIKELGDEVRSRGLELWMSEVDGNGISGENAGEMAAALWLSEKIIYDITQLKPSAWVLWQVIDTHVSDSGFGGRKDRGSLNLGGGYWGTAYADHNTGIIHASQKYYAFGQFTRYIRPGAVLIDCGRSPVKGCSFIAASDGKRGTFTIVAVNSTSGKQGVEFDVSDFGIRRSPVRTVRTSGDILSGEHWKEIEGSRVSRGKLHAELDPNSVTTYVIRYRKR